MAVIDRKERKDFEDTSYWSRLNQLVRSMGHLPDEISNALQILRSDAFYERKQFKEICGLLYKAGCRKIMFGLESGSQKMLDLVNKGIAVQHAEEILQNCAAAGIRFRVFAMIGLLHESVEEAFETDTGMNRITMKKVYREITGELYEILRVGEKYSGWEEYSLLTIDRLDNPEKKNKNFR
jgi:hypothetical protein